MQTAKATRNSAMPEMFVALMGAARRRRVDRVPRPQRFMDRCRGQSQLLPRTACHGGRIHEYIGGRLHAKTLTVDGAVALIGSANMDRCSFELNSENNILLCDTITTTAIRARQQTCLASASEITLAEVSAWRWPRRLWNNAIAMAGQAHCSEWWRQQIVESMVDQAPPSLQISRHPTQHVRWNTRVHFGSADPQRG